MPSNISFVTGANGFVGSALSVYLAGRGWVVRTDPLRLFANPERWQLAMNSAQCVVHLAAQVHRMRLEASGEAAYMQINVEGSRFAAEQAVRAGARRFVFLSSVKVNGEGGEGRYKATDEPAPRDPYGRSKLAAEQAVREVCEQGNVEWVIIRPPLVFGPGVKANFLRLMLWVDRGMPMPFSSIQNRRSLVGLSNLVSFIETCMVHSSACGRIWLIADDEPVSTPALLRGIARHMGRRLILYPFSAHWLRRIAAPLGLRNTISRLCDSMVVDASAARNDLGWRPISSFDDELARTVDAYQAEKHR